MARPGAPENRHAHDAPARVSKFRAKWGVNRQGKLQQQNGTEHVRMGKMNSRVSGYRGKEDGACTGRRMAVRAISCFVQEVFTICSCAIATVGNEMLSRKEWGLTDRKTENVAWIQQFGVWRSVGERVTNMQHKQ